jgi:hypothetical protein
LAENPHLSGEGLVIEPRQQIVERISPPHPALRVIQMSHQQCRFHDAAEDQVGRGALSGVT